MIYYFQFLDVTGIPGINQSVTQSEKQSQRIGNNANAICFDECYYYYCEFCGADKNINSISQKGGLDYIKKESADVFCIQETKCTDKEIPVEELKEAGFSAHFLSGDKAGYSGVGIIYKKQPLNITEGISMYFQQLR